MSSSHSFQDKSAIMGLKDKFERKGFPTYVDWICDPQLSRNNISKENSEQIRHRMNHSKTLVYVFTSNARESVWMPWELGYVDGKKTRCAVLRVENHDSDSFTYQGFEYLEIYPYVDETENNLWVNDSSGKFVSFSDWRNGLNPK